MSRNRCTSQCDCGYELSLRNATTRPLEFWEYLRNIGIQDHWNYPYYLEYETLLVCQVQCPECGQLYAMWLSNEFGCGRDTSYWYSFNDEPSERDILQRGMKK